MIVAGLRSQKGASWRVLEHADRAFFVVAASPALFLEYEQVLKRSDHRLAHDMVDGFLSELAKKIEPVQVRFVWRPQLTDPDDEMVLEAAINGHVDGIVTHNKRDFEAASRRFGLKVWTPGEFLQRLREEKME